MKKVINWLFDYPNLKVYQYEEGFKFSLDSILLAEFADIRKSDKLILDLCTGNGVIPILLRYKYGKVIYGMELQKDIYDLAIDSASYNKFDDLVFINDNILNYGKYFKKESFDVVLCNPPYFPYHDDEHVNKCEVKKVARHEIYVDLKGVMKVASELLRSKGRFYLVHVPSRLQEILSLASEYKLFVKSIQFVYAKKGKKSEMVLCSFLKSGQYGCKVMPPLCTYNLDSYQGIFRKEL